MNLQQPDANEAAQTANGSGSISPISGICTGFLNGCRGDCAAFKAGLRGREVICPGPFGTLTADADETCRVDYCHLSIGGYALGARGVPEGASGSRGNTLLPLVSTETEYGVKTKVKMRLPVFAGTLGSTEIARRNWEPFAAGAAISGTTIVCGENVCGSDAELELDSRGKVKRAPSMARRVQQYRRYREGYGDMIVQMNAEDARLGVAEYVVGQLGVECIELNWGQGVRCIGGEIRVDSIGHALELQRRGCLVIPDPSNPANQAAFQDGALRHFERHSRLGFVDQEGFVKEVEHVRRVGAKRVILRTGARSTRELAMAIKWASDAELDLLTLDGSPGESGTSPWRKMEQGGVPTFYLQSMTHDLCCKLAARGRFVPDIAIAGGFSTEDHVFKVLAMGAPFIKAVCMGRALMVPGRIGRSIGLWLNEGGEALPGTATRFGASVEETFVCYEGLVAKYGKETVKRLPLGAIALYAFSDRLKVGLQQLMAASGNFRISAIGRDDVMALTPEAAKVSGIPYIMDAYRDEAERIINA